MSLRKQSIFLFAFILATHILAGTAYANANRCGAQVGLELGTPNSQLRARLAKGAKRYELTGEDEGIAFVQTSFLNCMQVGGFTLGSGFAFSQSSRFDYSVYLDSEKRRIPANQYWEEVQANLYATVGEFLLVPKLQLSKNISLEPSIGIGLALNSTDSLHFYDECMYDEVACKERTLRKREWAFNLDPAYSFGLKANFGIGKKSSISLGYKYRDMGAYRSNVFGLGADAKACQDASCGTVQLGGYHKTHLFSLTTSFGF